MSAPDSVIKLAEARQSARADKDFALADSLRDQIFAAGNEFVNVKSDLRNGAEIVCTNWCTIVVRA